MTQTLKVFRGIDIPVDYASVQKYAILARSGFGKTYTLAKLLEQFCDAGLFFVCLDPVGKHYSLRVGADGTRRGGKSNVVVLGGQHGDVPLSAEDGGLIADVVVQHPGRYDAVNRETLAEQSGYSLTSSTFRNALSALRSNGLMVDIAGAAQASDALFITEGASR